MSRIAALLTLALSAFWIGLVSTSLPFVGGPYRGLDWIEVFDPATRLAAAGSVPYGVIPAASHPIHLYLLTAFTSLTTPEHSYTLWVAASLGVVAWAVWLLAGGTWQSTLAILASPFLALVVLLGEVTALEVLGLGLLLLALERRGAILAPALLVLSAVPPNTIPVAAWGTCRIYQENRALALIGVGVAGLAGGATFLLYGNWLAPYLSVPATSWADNQHINQSLWAYSPLLGLLALAVVGATTYLVWNSLLAAPTKLQLLYILASTLLTTPYLLGHRLFPLYLLLVAYLSERGKWFPIVLLLLAWGLFGVNLVFGPQFLYLLIPLAWGVALASLQTVKGLQHGYLGV